MADLHIHSHYSIATSKDMTPEGLWRWAQLKGISLAATGDFTHPGWFAELQEKLESHGEGLFHLKKRYQDEGRVPRSCMADVFFILSAEISCIYKKNGKTRKIHCLIYVPGLDEAARISRVLERIGNVASDGRPILGLDARELLRITLDTVPEALFVPAHVWTPHFSVFGAVSGFDSLVECFEDLTPHVFALETGLSSDPTMNWRLSPLDNITLISNSDAHSPSKLGREANILETDFAYSMILRALKTREGFLGTVEFFPQEGKYHDDGHRTCGVRLEPDETKRHGYRCPACGRKVTIGVAHRIDALADRKRGFVLPDAPPFRSVIPLVELLSEVMLVGPQSKKVEQAYMGLLSGLGSEFSILMDAPLPEIERASTPALAEAIKRMRDGVVSIRPGYDGQYGQVNIFNESERVNLRG
jgi:uncharacterized protein (TIGR00375 family)